MASSFSGLMAKGVPAMPIWLTIIRIIIIVLAFGCLVASAYAISVFGSIGYYYYSYGTPGFMIFVVSPVDERLTRQYQERMTTNTTQQSGYQDLDHRRRYARH